MHLQNFEKLQSRKLLVKYSAYAECEIMCCRTLWNIAPSSQCEMKFAHIRVSEYFTRRRRISHFAEIFHLPARANFVEKSTCLRKCFFLAGIAGFEPAKMPESKSGALPLGYIPMYGINIWYYNTIYACCQGLFLLLFIFVHYSFLGILRRVLVVRVYLFNLNSFAFLSA